MLQDRHSDSSGLYKIWKIEKRIWLEGQPAMKENFMSEAIIVPPHPKPVQRINSFLEAASRATPFDEVEFYDQKFIKLGDTVIITYHAKAKHKRFRQKYTARCQTTYVNLDGALKVASHSHQKLPRRA